jgi:multiple antibiotic resistance protein
MGILMHLETLFTYMTLTVLGLLPIMNPPAAATVLLGLSKGRDKSYIVSQAKTTGVYLFIALCITFFIGASVLELFSISIPSLRLGGGIIIVAIGFNMLFPRPDSGAAPSAQGAWSKWHQCIYPNYGLPIDLYGSAVFHSRDSRNRS